MLGFRFIKTQPTTYVLQYRGGKVVRDGAGLAFFYYGPTSTLVAVPVASRDQGFIFEQVTSDFQTVTVQGQVLRLLVRLRDGIGCSIMFISHDLGVAAQISDRVAVRYAGRVAEIAPEDAPEGE